MRPFGSRSSVADQWLLTCGHEIPRYAHQRLSKPPRRCPLCGKLQHVRVTLGVSGDSIFECERCGLTTYDEGEMNQHQCRTWTVFRKRYGWLAFPF